MKHFLGGIMFMFRVIIFIRFGFCQKNIIIFLKKTTETGLNQPVSVRIFRIKTSSNQFDLVLAWFFLVWLGFFRVFSVWVRFGFFGFRLIKLKLNRLVFFLILISLISFFSRFSFFGYFFRVF
jgi:hypothetical protein